MRLCLRLQEPLTSRVRWIMLQSSRLEFLEPSDFSDLLRVSGKLFIRIWPRDSELGLLCVRMGGHRHGRLRLKGSRVTKVNGSSKPYPNQLLALPPHRLMDNKRRGLKLQWRRRKNPAAALARGFFQGRLKFASGRDDEMMLIGHLESPLGSLAFMAVAVRLPRQGGKVRTEA